MISPKPIARRTFIKSGTCLALAAAVPGSDLLAASRSKRWVVGCRDVLLKGTGQADCWSAMKAIGAEGIEADVAMDMTCPNLFHPDRKYTLATEEGIAALKADLDRSGCRITTFMMANHLDERLDQELEWTRKLVAASAKLGVHTIRIDIVPRKLAGDEFLSFAISACKRMCDIAEPTPIRFGVENHGTITNDPEFLDKLFAGVGSPKLGLTLDTANFYWWGHPLKDLYRIYERVAPHAVHTHCKSIHYPEDRRNVRREMGWEYAKYTSPIYEGDIDFKRVVRILRKAGYQGDLCLENESLGKATQGERAEILRKEIALLKKLA